MVSRFVRGVRALNTIPAKFAEIFWNGDVGAAPRELVVVDRRTRFTKGRLMPGRSFDEYGMSLGAMEADWLLKEDDPTNTPEGVFAYLYLDQTPDRTTIKSGLKEFAKIQECEWARRMFKALDGFEHDRLG